MEPVHLDFEGSVWFWKGPAPWYFVTVPSEESAQIKEIERFSTYGWGMIPVEATIGSTTWTTSLWPHNGQYILPLKVDVRRREKIELDHVVRVEMSVILS